MNIALHLTLEELKILQDLIQEGYKHNKDYINTECGIEIQEVTKSTMSKVCELYVSEEVKRKW